MQLYQLPQLLLQLHQLPPQQRQTHKIPSQDRESRVTESKRSYRHGLQHLKHRKVSLLLLPRLLLLLLLRQSNSQRGTTEQQKIPSMLKLLKPPNRNLSKLSQSRLRSDENKHLDSLLNNQKPKHAKQNLKACVKTSRMTQENSFGTIWRLSLQVIPTSSKIETLIIRHLATTERTQEKRLWSTPTGDPHDQRARIYTALSSQGNEYHKDPLGQARRSRLSSENRS